MKQPYKPFDIVRLKGCIGMITEVNVNKCQTGFKDVFSYSIDWLEGDLHNSWHEHDTLEVIGNFMEKIARNMCHPLGDNEDEVKNVLNGSVQYDE